MDGVIATNTTVSRSALAAFPGIPAELASQAGGLSGLPLREQSTALVARIAKCTAGRLPIVAVGGIMSPRDAQQKLEAGASLVQLYTGLVYAGPGLVHEILTSLNLLSIAAAEKTQITIKSPSPSPSGNFPSPKMGRVYFGKMGELRANARNSSIFRNFPLPLPGRDEGGEHGNINSLWNGELEPPCPIRLLLDRRAFSDHLETGLPGFQWERVPIRID